MSKPQIQRNCSTCKNKHKRIRPARPGQWTCKECHAEYMALKGQYRTKPLAAGSCDPSEDCHFCKDQPAAAHSYEMGHPWFGHTGYPPPDEILVSDKQRKLYGSIHDLPKSLDKLKERLKSTLTEMQRDYQTYEHYRVKQFAALSRFDMLNEDCKRLALATVLSLKHNHILHARWEESELRKAIAIYDGKIDAKHAHRRDSGSNTSAKRPNKRRQSGAERDYRPWRQAWKDQKVKAAPDRGRPTEKERRANKPCGCIKANATFRRVLETRMLTDGKSVLHVRRRCECSHCGHRWTEFKKPRAKHTQLSLKLAA